MEKRLRFSNRKLWESRTNIRGFKGVADGMDTDEVDLDEKLAVKMHDIGYAHREESLPIPIELFSADFFFHDYESLLYELAQPMKPYRDDQSIYGLIAAFSTTQKTEANYVEIEIGMHETHGDSGGFMSAAVVKVFFEGESISVFPVAIDEDALFMTDYETLELMGEWLGYMWKGIMYCMVHKPEIIRVANHRIPKDESSFTSHTNQRDKRVAKVQRVITIVDDGKSEIIVKRGNHTFTLPVWSVAGHWRTLNNGRQIWVRPHLKGKDRKNGKDLCKKEYRFLREDE